MVKKIMWFGIIKCRKDETEKPDFDDIINEFAPKKAKKRTTVIFTNLRE